MFLNSIYNIVTYPTWPGREMLSLLLLAIGWQPHSYLEVGNYTTNTSLVLLRSQGPIYSIFLLGLKAHMWRVSPWPGGHWPWMCTQVNKPSCVCLTLSTLKRTLQGRNCVLVCVGVGYSIFASPRGNIPRIQLVLELSFAREQGGAMQSLREPVLREETIVSATSIVGKEAGLIRHKSGMDLILLLVEAHNFLC